eukprot:scaffold20207_cov68-Phaeocystis_antarctica.AAC.1
MADQRGPAIEVCPATRLLTVAVRKGCQTSVRALLERGADVKLFNDDGTTALMVAAEEARPELVRWLLVAKADPLACDYDGRNALGHVQSRHEKRRDRASIVDLLSRPESVFEAPLTGATGLVTGLATQPQLNGRRGAAASYDAMSGRYVVQLENGPVVRVRPLNLAKFDVPLSASLNDPTRLVAPEEGANRQADADRRLRRVLHSDEIDLEIDLEALKAAINELHGHASAELLTEARRKREQLKERARKGAKAEIERLRKVRGEAAAATTAAAATKESACAAAEGARAAAANEVATRQAEEAARQVEAALCVVCLDNAKTHVFVPCGHYSCCAECIALIANGPPGSDARLPTLQGHDHDGDEETQSLEQTRHRVGERAPSEDHTTPRSARCVDARAPARFLGPFASCRAPATRETSRRDAMLSAIALAATARRLEDGTCPCLATTQVHEPAGEDISFTLVGETYTYPSDYGLTCAAHDSATQPYCARSAPPNWCADAWCYVDRTNCNLPFSNSVFFSSLAYSYFTCGASNTFDAWFGDSGSGGGGGVHALTDLVALMKTYTQTISDTLEENFAEAQS